MANSVIAQMLFLQMSDPKKDIHIYINSPGGSVTAGLAIYDTMQFVTCDVEYLLHWDRRFHGCAPADRGDPWQTLLPPQCLTS